MRAIFTILVLFALTACSKQSQPNPRADLERIVANAKPPTVGTVISFRTEPTDTPSHSAVIQGVKKGEVYQFSVFCKNGTWYYDRPISLVDNGTVIHERNMGAVWNTLFSIMAYEFAFKR